MAVRFFRDSDGRSGSRPDGDAQGREIAFVWRGAPVAIRPEMRFAVWIGTTWVASLGFWLTFGACIDAPVAAGPPDARIVVYWDPLACVDPHRVVVELDDVQGSAPCTLGGITLDAPHFGTYRGRVVAWSDRAASREAPIEIEVDAPVVRVPIAMPP